MLIVTTSWDDGAPCDFKLANLLRKHGIKATFYVSKTHSYLDRPLTSEEIKILSHNFEIGAHTLSHPDLTRLSLDAARKEIMGSKSYLEEVIGKEVRSFCYPGGKFNTDLERLVSESGFSGARTCKYDGFNMTNVKTRLGVSLQATNRSPLYAFRICRDKRLPIGAYFDWEVRGKKLFDIALTSGGVFHLWGHSSEFEKYSEWDKIERVIKYISNNSQVDYLSNGDIFSINNR